MVTCNAKLYFHFIIFIFPGYEIFTNYFCIKSHASRKGKSLKNLFKNKKKIVTGDE